MNPPWTGPGRPVAGAPPWVTVVAPGAGGHTAMLVFPHAGGAASAYRRWTGALRRSGVDVWPVQLPGRENRYGEPLCTDLGRLVRSMGEALAPALAKRRYAIYGHSAGAWLGYGFALHARTLGLPAPRRLFLAASRPPAHPDPDFPIHRLPPPALLAKLRQFGGLPDEVAAFPELLERAVATARSDLRLVEAYPWRPGDQVDCPVTALGGVADRTVPVAVLPAWRAITEAPFDVVTWPGGHFPPPAAERQLMEAIANALD